ncbi:MAG: sigma-54-dependent Fis family transcriptional regulator, partial [Lentisphaeraceae bacterium]|nr:sigma-54-dependent Fis family transcriptional regulator [Lentisphaeraceae bacterium]
VDVRLVAATNRDLRTRVDAGEFREDLYYRLDVLNVVLPPLRERRQDIPLLLNYYLERCAAENNKIIKGFTAEAVKILSEYSWRGNVRELRNVVERMSVMSLSDVLDTNDIPAIILDDKKRPMLSGTQVSGSLDVSENENELIIRALKETNNNKTAAAKILGMSRRTLHRRITELGLNGNN